MCTKDLQGAQKTACGSHWPTRLEFKFFVDRSQGWEGRAALSFPQGRVHPSPALSCPWSHGPGRLQGKAIPACSSPAWGSFTSSQGAAGRMHFTDSPPPGFASGTLSSQRDLPTFQSRRVAASLSSLIDKEGKSRGLPAGLHCNYLK